MSVVDRPSVAVVGAGWAGCAAAAELTLRGFRVHLFEASKNLGGRARRLRLPGIDEAPDAWETRLDNGQHILLGTYTESLRLMRAVGLNLPDVLLRLPLQMRYPPETGGMDFLSVKLPAPLHLAVPLLRTRGLTIADKLSLLRFFSAARWMGWQLNQDCSVADFLEIHNQTARVIDLLWRPLCLAALNTPLDKASAQVFLTVLRDSLGAERAASDMLIPRVDLSALFPTPAAAFIEKHGGRVMRGVRVTGITGITGVIAQIRTANHANGWQLQFLDDHPGQQDGEQPARYDAVVLATPMNDTTRLLSGGNDASESVATNKMVYEPIITCYLQYEPGLRLPLPFYALQDLPSQQRWGQFVFDRGHLDPTQAGLLAVVISAASEAADLGQDALCDAIAQQLAMDFRNPALRLPQRVMKICEKRATFSCTPNLVRPSIATGIPGIVRAGDYVSCNDVIESDCGGLSSGRDYPATIEAAVRSGVRAAAHLCRGVVFPST